MYPRISIITPSYNQAQYLEETIISIIGQGYQNLEYIIIDGGSKDESVEIIKKYESQLCYWLSEKDSGQSNAINKGLKRATGDIITWINSDDVLLPGSLHQIGTAFAQASLEVGVIHGGTILFNEHGHLNTVFNYGKPGPEKYFSSMAFSQPAAFFRKAWLEKVGFLNEDLHYGMDYDLFARLSLVCNFHQTSDVYSRYRLHDESKSMAHHDKFRTDWNRIFLSLCKHLHWEDLITSVIHFIPELKKEDKLLTYTFVPNENKVQRLDKEKVLFYFLTDLLLHYYWYDQREAARVLQKEIRKSFPHSWLREDPRVRAVIRKLMLPEFVLKSLKQFKNIF